jgi:hypothetical protein
MGICNFSQPFSKTVDNRIEWRNVDYKTLRIGSCGHLKLKFCTSATSSQRYGFGTIWIQNYLLKHSRIRIQK